MSTDVIKLPKGSSYLAKSIAARIEFIRTERGLDTREAAKQCGLDFRRWEAFEGAVSIPEPDEIERIVRWAYEGVNFVSYPLSKERKIRYVERGKGWQAHSFDCNRELNVKMMRTAARLSMTVNSFIQLCVESFIERDNVVSTYEEAARRIDKARTVERVSQDPYLQSFLSGDLDIAVAMGARLKEHKKEPRPQTHIDKLFEAQASIVGDDEWELVD